ncbi:MAG TPA: tetratricopeptide repeat protein [Acetobacteraceae bacterium]
MKDAQGQALSGATAEAVAPYDRAVRAFNLGYGDAPGLFDAAREAAPGFVMAHLANAWMFALSNDPSVLDQARLLMEPATGLDMNERERGHLAALKQVLVGARGAAVAQLDALLMRHPLDLVAHQAATLLDGYQGRFRWVRDRSARALPFWSKDQPGYGTMLAFHGFGLEEAGDYARAEDESREAAELEPHSFWPHHTVAHVMEMTGRPEDGLGWMAAREPFWSAPDNVTQVHIWWHKSLFHLELGQLDAALALYDGPLLATLRPLALNLCNASALLWRLDMLGCDVSGRWRDLLPHWEGHADGCTLMFNDLHAAMAELGAGEERSAERRVGWMRETAATNAEVAGCYREVGIPLVEGFIAFHRRAYAQAVDLLLPVRFGLWRIGGSKAQRDVVDWTLTEAAIRAGQRDIALSLANERLGLRPRSAVNRCFQRRAASIAT